MNNLLTEFQESIRNLGLAQKTRLLLAVSGGLDSVVLADCCAMAGLDFAIAHANFQLRDTESQRDEDFVRKLAAYYNKPVFIKKMNTRELAEKEKCSIQVAARNLRYNWFKTLIGNEPAHFQFLLTAHHLDDNIETLLMHFFRGTGIEGLTGMPVRNEWILRPLLSIPKKQIRDFALAKKLDWVEDSSNWSDDYTRNYFRNQLIPSIEKVFPDVYQNLEKNLHRFSEAAHLYRQAVSIHKKKLLTSVGTEIHIPILLLRKAVPLSGILYEILKDYHFTPAQTKDVIHLMDSSNGKYVSGSTHRVIKNRRWLIIAPEEDLTNSHFIIEQNQSFIDYPEGRLYLKLTGAGEKEPINKSSVGASLDANKIQFPLILRKWKAGDYFYPLGMKKKKKLARFFIDQKLSKTAKEKIWVLLMDSQIIWVVGQRIDNRFAIGLTTSKVLEIITENNPV